MGLQKAIAKLVAHIDEHDRLIEHYFALNASLNALELLNGEVKFAAVKVALCKAGPSLDVVVDSKFKSYIVKPANQRVKIDCDRRCTFILLVFLVFAADPMVV